MKEAFLAFIGIFDPESLIEMGGYGLAVLMTGVTSYAKSSQKLQKLATKVVNDVESSFNGISGRGEIKFDYALTKLYDCVPVIFRPLLTKEKLKKLLQNAFDELAAFAAKQADKAIDQVEMVIYGSEEGKE